MNIRFSPALILLLLLSACDQKTTDAPVPPRQVKIATAEAASPLSTRVFPARILAGDNTDIAFKRAGQLQTLEVREGEAVKQGQILARLTNNDARQRLNDRQSAATLAQRQFDVIRRWHGATWCRRRNSKCTKPAGIRPEPR